jgi:hypothetical protein
MVIEWATGLFSKKIINYLKYFFQFVFVVVSFHTFDSDKDKNDDGTVEEEDEGEEEFWNGGSRSTPTTPSPIKMSASNGPLAKQVPCIFLCWCCWRW